MDVEGWERSAAHRKNMLDRDATEIGVAVAHSPRTGRYYGVQVFGRPRGVNDGRPKPFGRTAR